MEERREIGTGEDGEGGNEAGRENRRKRGERMEIKTDEERGIGRKGGRERRREPRCTIPYTRCSRRVDLCT